MTGSIELALAGERLQLRSERAIHLPAHGTLLVADVHVGKAQSFRRLGVPVPGGTTADTLRRLDGLLDATDARRIVFLGDFLHSPRSHAAATLAAVGRWRAQHPELQLVLVRGNHDDRAGDPPAEFGFEVVDEPLRVGALALCHHPRPLDGAFVIAGAGMGLGFTRTGVAMLAASTDSDRGFNSSALSIADALGAALALSLCGIGFSLATDAEANPFLAVFGVAIVCSIGALVTASRTPCTPVEPVSAPSTATPA